MVEKVISVTLVGPGDARFLPDMLKSVDWCKTHYLIPWNESVENVCEALATVGNPDIEVLDPIEAVGFGEARTKAFRRFGADDAEPARLMIDCDERWLGGPPIWPCGVHDVVSVICGDRTRLYARMPRLFGAGVVPSWEGETHEWYTGPRSEIGLSDRYEIVEIPKTPDRMARKLARDLPLLQRMCAKDPLNVRHRFYVGETFRGLAALE